MCKLFMPVMANHFLSVIYKLLIKVDLKTIYIRSLAINLLYILLSVKKSDYDITDFVGCTILEFGYKSFQLTGQILRWPKLCTTIPSVTILIGKNVLLAFSEVVAVFYVTRVLKKVFKFY